MSDQKLYNIVRFYRESFAKQRIIKRNLTLDEARASKMVSLTKSHEAKRGTIGPMDFAKTSESQIGNTRIGHTQKVVRAKE